MSCFLKKLMFLLMVVHFAIGGCMNADRNVRWEPLFDGKSLKGWHTIPGGKWEVRNGVIEGTSQASDKRHGLLVSDGRYDNFTVQLKFKALKGNSGFYFRAEKVEGIAGVYGFQAEIDPSQRCWSGGLYETGGRAWVAEPNAEEIKKWFRPQDWNQMSVSAHGGHIVVHLNGYKSAELNNDPGRPEGHFALQLHGGEDMHVMFKDIKILASKK